MPARGRPARCPSGELGHAMRTHILRALTSRMHPPPLAPQQANGVTPTKPNPEFGAAIAAAAAGGKSVSRAVRQPHLPAGRGGTPVCASLRGRCQVCGPAGRVQCRAPPEGRAPAKALPPTPPSLSLFQVVLACEAGGTTDPSVNFP